MDNSTLCQELALAFDDGPCCWCCEPCQTSSAGRSCCCATGTCTQPCCVPREHAFAGELWFQQQTCDQPPKRNTGLLEVPWGGRGLGGSLDGSAKIGVLLDGAPLSSGKTGGCCGKEKRVLEMGGRVGAAQNWPAFPNVVNPGLLKVDNVLQTILQPNPQPNPALVCEEVWDGLSKKPQAQKGFGASLPEHNFLLERPSDEFEEKVTPVAPDGALGFAGAVAGQGGVAYPLPAMGGKKAVREIISNLRVPNSTAPANRFMYAHVFNGTTLGTQPAQPGGASSLAGILDSTPSRILRKAAVGKEATAGLSVWSEKGMMAPQKRGVSGIGLVGEKVVEKRGVEKLVKLTPAAVLAGVNDKTRVSQLPVTGLLEVKRKCCSSELDVVGKRFKPSKPALVSPSALLSPVSAASNSSSSSSDDLETSSYDPSIAYRLKVCGVTVPSNGGAELPLPETPVPCTGSTSEFLPARDLPFSPESFEGRNRAVPKPIIVRRPALEAGLEGGLDHTEISSPGSTGSGIVTKGSFSDGEVSPKPEVAEIGVSAEQLRLFRELQVARVQGTTNRGVAGTRNRGEEGLRDPSDSCLGSLSRLSGTADILLKVLTSELSARDLARLEATCSFFRSPASFAPDVSMPLTVVAAYRACQAHPVYKACSAASQGRLLLRCGGDWKLTCHHLNALDRANSTDDGMVEVGPDFSCVVNDTGELRIFGGSKARFPCLGNREVDQLWEQRIVGHELTNKRITCVAAGPSSVVAVTSSGDVYSFGKNENGCLGIPGQEEVELPQLVTSLAGIPIAEVACGAAVTTFLSRDGRVYTSGSSSSGVLGHGPDCTFLDVPVMVQALAEKRVIQIAAGFDHLLAVTDKGEVYAWGEGSKGQLGRGGEEGRKGLDAFRCENTPQRLSRLADFDAHIVQVAAGPNHSVALAADGRVFVWGIPPNGIRSREVQEEDAHVRDLRGIDDICPVQVAAGALTTFVVGDRGEVYSFGCCFYGELGLEGWGLVTLEPKRVEVLRAHKVVQVAASWFRHTVARTALGEVVVMGLNSSGQLGIPFTEAHAGVWKPRVIGHNCTANK